MRIFIGADHRGFELKKYLTQFLADRAEVIDLGAPAYNADDDYNGYAVAVARAVLAEQNSYGILVCGSSHGVCIQANRIRGARAISGFSSDMAKVGREHNDANILCLDSDFLTQREAESVINAFLDTKFLNEARYIRRNQKLDEEL